jgi:hypothetical protein
MQQLILAILLIGLPLFASETRIEYFELTRSNTEISNRESIPAKYSFTQMDQSNFITRYQDQSEFTELISLILRNDQKFYGHFIVGIFWEDSRIKQAILTNEYVDRIETLVKGNGENAISIFKESFLEIFGEELKPKVTEAQAASQFQIPEKLNDSPDVIQLPSDVQEVYKSTVDAQTYAFVLKRFFQEINLGEIDISLNLNPETFEKKLEINNWGWTDLLASLGLINNSNLSQVFAKNKQYGDQIPIGPAIMELFFKDGMIEFAKILDSQLRDFFFHAFFNFVSDEQLNKYAIDITDFVESKREGIPYQNLTHSHDFINHQEVHAALSMIYRLFTEFSPSQFDATIIERLLANSNTSETDSRRELSDLMVSYIIQSSDSMFYLQRPEIPRTKRNAMARDYFRTMLRPDSITPLYDLTYDLPTGRVLMCLHHGDKKLQLQYDGSERIEVHQEWFNGEIVLINLGQNLVYQNIPVDQYKAYLKCGPKEYEIEIYNTPKPFQLKDDLGLLQDLNIVTPANFNFSFGDDQLFTATSTIGFVSEMTPILDATFKGIIKQRFGYDLIDEQTEIPNIVDSIKVDLANSDLFLPSTHSLSMDTFVVGNKGTRRLVFQKELDNGNRIQLITYVPPTNFLASFSKVKLEENDFISVFEAREKLDRDRMYILNVSCDVSDTVRQWLDVFVQSMDEVEIPYQRKVDAINNHAPVVVAADRSFETNSASKLMEVLAYPMGVIQLVEQEASHDQVIHFLETHEVDGEGFQPISNLDEEFDPNRILNVDYKILN